MMPGDEIPEVFQFDDEAASFDALGKENGFRYWSARQLQALLGYASWKSFEQVVNKAVAACMTLGIPVIENILQTQTILDDVEVPDYKLSKFACYLVAMNGDPKIEAVAKAQAYFAAIAEAVQKYVKSAEDIERLDIRMQLRDREKGLSSVASRHGVETYAFFQDAGYRGMYNMSLRQLRQHKGLDGKQVLLDFMGKRELAANLFRLTETQARIENNDIRGQKPLEVAATDVGREVRSMMLRQGGAPPEDLPLRADIKKIGTDLRATHKQLKKPAGGKGKKHGKK